MRTFLLLSGHLGWVAVLYLLPPSLLGLNQAGATGLIWLWRESVGIFVLPTLFLVFFWKKNILLKLSLLAWSLWMGSLSLGLLWNTPRNYPEVTLLGRCLVGMMAVFSLSLFLATFFGLNQSGRKKEKKLSELLLFQEQLQNKTPATDQPNRFLKVEGS